MKICEMMEDEKPRERLLENGARNLSDAELLAVLLRTGTQGMNALDTARDLLRKVGNSLESLLNVSVAQLCSVKGVGQGKAVGLIAAMELGRRLSLEKSRTTLPIRNSSDAYVKMKPLFSSDIKEECWCMFLRRSRKIIATVKISEGNEMLTEINIKSIVRQALDCKAAAIIVAHNHPSGDSHPSVEDIKTTRHLSHALSTFELSLMDHIILGDAQYYSFNDNEVFSQ